MFSVSQSASHHANEENFHLINTQQREKYSERGLKVKRLQTIHI